MMTVMMMMVTGDENDNEELCSVHIYSGDGVNPIKYKRLESDVMSFPLQN